MRLYWEVARRGFRRYVTYRGATLAGIFTNTVFGFIRAYVLIALFRARGSINGYDLTDALTYNWVIEGLLMVMNVFGWQELALRVRSGDIATDLMRPYDIQGYWLAQDYGRALFHLGARWVPPFAIGALFFHLRLPMNAATYAAFVVSLAAGVTVSFAFRFLYNLASFWLVEFRGPMIFATSLMIFFSGAALPLTLYPAWLRVLCRALPFASTMQAPADVFLEKPGAIAYIGVQILWAAILLWAGRLVLAAGGRRLVVQGG